jgi:hypothetical protein
VDDEVDLAIGQDLIDDESAESASESSEPDFFADLEAAQLSIREGVITSW